MIVRRAHSYLSSINHSPTVTHLAAMTAMVHVVTTARLHAGMTATDRDATTVTASRRDVTIATETAHAALHRVGRRNVSVSKLITTLPIF